MYVMTIDQRGSRARADAVPGLLDILTQVHAERGFERTIGDEVQGVLDSPAQVTLAVRMMAAQTGWHIGIGIGPVETPLPATTAEGRGEAFYAARRAVEAAKSAPAHLVVDAATSADESTGKHGTPDKAGDEDSAASTPRADHPHLAESALRLMIWTFENIRSQSRRYIEHRLNHPESTQRDIADHFQVSQQAVSRVLSPGGVELIDGACALSTFHLSHVGSARAIDSGEEQSKVGDHVV